MALVRPQVMALSIWCSIIIGFMYTPTSHTQVILCSLTLPSSLTEASKTSPTVDSSL